VDCADRIALMMDDLESPVSEPLIVSPSAGRADTVKVTQLIPDIALCVPAREAEAYRRGNPDSELIVHPDSVRGLSAKRQWIFERYGDVFMFDDDVSVMTDLTKSAGEPMRVKDGQIVRDLVYRLFDQAAQMGAYLVGFANFANPTASRPQIPFELTGFVPGRSLGVRAGGKLFFPDKKLITDDMFVSALNAHAHRFCLRDCRYATMAPGTWVNEGGMNAYRTWDTLLENNRYMVEMFGEEAIQAKQGTALAKKRHDGQIVLKIPW
jgi:hypothetical protein